MVQNKPIELNRLHNNSLQRFWALFSPKNECGATRRSIKDSELGRAN